MKKDIYESNIDKFKSKLDLYNINMIQFQDLLGIYNLLTWDEIDLLIEENY